MAKRAPNSSAGQTGTEPVKEATEDPTEEPAAAEPPAGPERSKDTIATTLSEDCLVLNPALNPPFTDEKSRQIETDMATRMSTARKQLRASKMREHRHVRAMMTKDYAERLKLLSQVLNDDPNNLLALWHAAHTCADLSRDLGCPFREWEQRLMQLDSQNSRVWLFVASNQYKAGKTADALDSLKRAATSAESRHYNKESMNMYQEAFASTGLFPSTEEVMLGVTFGMDWHPSYRLHEKMCFEQSEINVEWALACSDFGARNTSTLGLVAPSKSANAIHVNALRNLGQPEKARKIQNDFSSLTKSIQNFSRMHNDERKNLLLANPQMFEQALNYIRNEGEVAGYQHLSAELDKAYSRSNRPECNSEQAPDEPAGPAP